MGERTHLPLTPRTQPSAATLARALQPTQTTQLARRPTPDQPRSQRPWAEQLGAGPSPVRGTGFLRQRQLRVATHEPDVRPALRRVRFLDDVKSGALVERDVALRTGLENHGGAAHARLLEPELDEVGADPASLRVGYDSNGVEMPEGSLGIFDATQSQKSA